MSLIEELQQLEVPEGKLGICWVNQAGFLFKDSCARIAAVDLYLTDCGARMKEFKAFKRLSAKLIDPKDLAPDYYMITHSHFDHFDYDAVPAVAAHGKTTFVTTPSCSEILKGMDIPENQICSMDYDQTVELDGITITAVEADHGDMVPDSFGYIVEMSDHVIYITGDTCYRRDIFQKVAERKPDIIVTCINGRFGNLNSEEGAMAAKEVGATYAVPCHFWTFMEHGGDPQVFCREIEKLDNCTAVLFTEGECKVV